jgi:cyanophycinase
MSTRPGSRSASKAKPSSGKSADGKPANGKHPSGRRAGGTRHAAGAAGATSSRHGTLIAVGGGEDKEGERLILREIVRRAHGGALVLATVASKEPEAVWATYDPLFRELGVTDLRHLDVESREAACTDDALEVLRGARAVYFTGGDQLRITSLLGGSAVARRIHGIYSGGGVVAGTSAGASVMSATMFVGGESGSTHHLGDGLRMAPGLGFLPAAIVDQHFTERGRMGRLLGAVAQNPLLLGIGIDEDTALIVEGPAEAPVFEVIGNGGVYVVDGRDISYTNVSDEARDCTLSLFDLRLHVLSASDVFDVATRRPVHRPSTEGANGRAHRATR